MVGFGDTLPGSFVQPGGDSLALAPVLHEDERCVVGANQLQQFGYDLFPDARIRKGCVILHNREDLDIELSPPSSVHNFHRPGPQLSPGRPAGRVSSEKLRHLFDWAHRGGKADALEFAAQLDQPFQRQRKMRAPFVAGQRMHFIDNHKAQAGKDPLALRPGQQNVERFRRSDQNMRRPPDHLAAPGGRGVAGAHRYANDAGAHNAFQRRPQVALDIIVERLQRRDVQHSRAAFRGAIRMQHQRLNRPQERGECFAGAGGRDQKRMPARRDGRPALFLRRRRATERPRKPVANRGSEQIESGRHIGKRTASKP